jgi:hypothetical protein
MDSKGVLDNRQKNKNYNAFDTGGSLCFAGIFEAMEKAISEGKEDLSGGSQELARIRRMEARHIGELFWQDIDDEESRLAAEKRLSKLELNDKRPK